MTKFVFLSRESLKQANFDDGHLLEILRTKDSQIVDLEVEGRENQKVIDLQENQIEKLREEVKTYQTMLEVSVCVYIRTYNSNYYLKVLIY